MLGAPIRWTLVVRGDSMRFLLKAGDVILVRRAPLCELRLGDLAVLLDWRGGKPDYVVHRLIGRYRRGGSLYAVTKGDANLLPDPATPESGIVGVVESVRIGRVWRALKSRAPGLALGAFTAPLYRGFSSADGLCEAVLRLSLMRRLLSRRARGALLALLAWRERMTSGAYGCLQALSARWTCGGETAIPAEAAAAPAVLGIIDADQTWSGHIRVDGDVYVPPGVTLRVEPGTEVVFRADSQWDCLREGRIWKDRPQAVENKCRLLIGGCLRAEGTLQAPISLGGADWGGIHFVTDSRGSTLVHCDLSRSLCAAVTLHDSAQAALTLSRLSDCESGVALFGPGASVSLEDCRIERCRRRGLSSAGGVLSARRVVIKDCGEIGVFAHKTDLELEDCELSGSPVGLGQTGGSARLTHVSVLRAAKAALEFDGGAHELRGVLVEDCGEALCLGGGRLLLEDFEMVGCSSGVTQRGGELNWSGGRGLVLSPGVVRRVEGASAFKRALRAAVLRTRRLSVFAAAYRAVYSLPVRALQLWAVFDGNVTALCAHRSWTRRDWDPGLSDVDLLVAARDLAGENGRRWLERFWTWFLRLKCVFPFLGECLAAEPAELAAYARWGGFRGRGFMEQLTPLNGSLPEADARPVSLKTALEPLGELAHAYTRLMSSALWRPESSQAGRSAARNAALDVVRLHAAGADSGSAELAPREEALAAGGSAAAVLRAPLSALAEGESSRARAELCAAGLSLLHDGAVLALASWPAAVGLSRLRWAREEAGSSSARDVELRRRRGLAEEYARVCGGALVAGCADDLYRTCLVIDDGAASSPALPAVFEGLSRHVSLRGQPATLPIVLTVSAWKVWSRLAYLESPVRFLEPGGGTGDFLTRAGAPLPGAWQYAWGRERLAPVETPDALVLDLARESLATLRCVWRYQASQASPLSNDYVQHYLLGRTMGLRLLLERGVGASFFALDPLRALYAREFPERMPELERLWTCLIARDGPVPWTELYAWVDAELRG